MATVKYFDTEFQDSQGWKCMNASDLANGSNIWWKLPRILGLSIDTYITKLVKEFKVTNIRYHENSNILSFGWERQSDMRKFKNWANREYRKIM